MKFISFNINGIRARLHQLSALLEKHQPDVVGLQEIKVDNPVFPVDDVKALGYEVYYHGQKGHYGVAFLTKNPVEQVYMGFPTDAEDAQRRMIIIDYKTEKGETVRVLNGYFPQGENRSHETKFPNKAQFYLDLDAYLQQYCQSDNHVVIMGDFNISHTDSDIGIGEENKKRWLRTGKCSFLPEEREWLNRLMSWGVEDTFRNLHPDVTDRYSWFDYRSKGFNDNRGLRIDLILATRQMAAKVVEAGIDYDLRAMEKPSDHAPIWASFKDL
ncbi:MAG: exodeoxyribonuclease III [Pseudomonadota bacterium]